MSWCCILCFYFSSFWGSCLFEFLAITFVFGFAGVSGEKIEIDPVLNNKAGSRYIWNKQKAVTYDIDAIVACDLTQNKSNKATFRWDMIPKIQNVISLSILLGGDWKVSLSQLPTLANFLNYRLGLITWLWHTEISFIHEQKFKSAFEKKINLQREIIRIYLIN